MARYHTSPEIENPAAYADAIQRRIRENARKGRGQRWMAEDPSRAELIERLRAHVYGTKPAHIQLLDATDCSTWSDQDQETWDAWRKSQSRRYVSPFLEKMLDNYREWNTLTAGQEKAVREGLDKVEAKDAEIKAERAAKRAAEGAASTHVGKIGERLRDLALTVRFVTDFESDYGMVYVTGFEDTSGNQFVVKGAQIVVWVDDGRTWRCAERGSKVVLAGTVKSHGERDGVKQTVLQRCKVATIEKGA